MAKATIKQYYQNHGRSVLIDVDVLIDLDGLATLCRTTIDSSSKHAIELSLRRAVIEEQERRAATAANESLIGMSFDIIVD